MDKQLLIQQKQNLASLEANEKKIQIQMNGKKRNRNVGIVITALGLAGIFIGGMTSIDSAEIRMLGLIAGIVGLILIVIFAVGLKRTSANYSVLLSDMEKIKKQIIETENS